MDRTGAAGIPLRMPGVARTEYHHCGGRGRFRRGAAADEELRILVVETKADALFFNRDPGWIRSAAMSRRR